MVEKARSTDRRERLAQALRENLKRRKQRVRAKNALGSEMERGDRASAQDNEGTSRSKEACRNPAPKPG